MKKTKINFQSYALNTCIIILLVIGSLGCANKTNSNKPTYSFEFNFLKQEYDPNYNQYEKIITVNKNNSDYFNVTSSISSGVLSLHLFNPDGQLVKQLSIDGNINEDVSIDKAYGDWKVIIEINQDTEGHIKISN